MALATSESAHSRDPGMSALAPLLWAKRTSPFLKTGGSVAEYQAGFDRALARGWLTQHESGTYVRFTEAGAAMFA